MESFAQRLRKRGAVSAALLVGGAVAATLFGVVLSGVAYAKDKKPTEQEVLDKNWADYMHVLKLL
jgi:hypothetical protein